jgi:hypothetical protein
MDGYGIIRDENDNRGCLISVQSKVTVRRTHIATGLAGLWLLLAPAASVRAQIGFGIPPLPSGPSNPPKIVDRTPETPNATPAFTIPLSALGFSTPGDNYLMRQQSVVSLDFLDEDRLLFSFHVASGLRKRRSGGEVSEQRIRALMVEVATGKVESQAEWTVPDRSRYLWMLNDGHFLLRVKDGLDEGDARLKTKAYLRLPGKLMWIEMDPKQQFLIANSVEPANGEAQGDEASASGQQKTSRSAGKQNAADQRVLVARTMRRETNEVIRTTRVPWTSQKNDWPMNSEGYLERVHERGANWTLKLSGFTGGEGRAVGQLESTCLPKYEFISDTELLISRCDPQQGWKLEAMSSGGKLLWGMKAASNAMWPILVTARNGSRMARETLLLKRPVERYKRLIGAEDLLGQVVRVFDSASGKVLVESPLKPVFDGGGNVAISPSGRRAAVLNAGAIQVFELPAARINASQR